MSGGEPAFQLIRAEHDEMGGFIVPLGAVRRRIRAFLKEPRPAHPVRALRRGQLMSQGELAARAGVSARTVARVEAGSVPRRATQRGLLRALGMPWEKRHLVFRGTVGEA